MPLDTDRRFLLAGTTYTWDVEPQSWTCHEDRLTATAAGHTDIFRSPFGWTTKTNAARALATPPTGDWQLQARLQVDFHADWDAGSLFIWSNDDTWAKLNYELAPGGTPSVFSVVTRNGRSDDAVGPAVAADGLWLRISSLDNAYAFHCSADGNTWHLIRQFSLDSTHPVRVGLEVQSPIGDGCEVVFDNTTLTPTRLAHLFDGR